MNPVPYSPSPFIPLALLALAILMSSLAITSAHPIRPAHPVDAVPREEPTGSRPLAETYHAAEPDALSYWAERSNR